MWSQYADNHRGICLVFSLDKLLNHIPVDIKTNHFLDNESINIYPGRVRYDNDIRKLDDALTIDVSNDKGKTDEQLMGERIDVLLFNKYKDYEHENEFRIALFSKKFTFMDTIDIGFGNALEGIILGTRFKNVYAPTILKLASELDVPILKLNWMNGIPDLEEYTMH
jgi:hypothetical protein